MITTTWRILRMSPGAAALLTAPALAIVAAATATATLVRVARATRASYQRKARLTGRAETGVASPPVAGVRRRVTVLCLVVAGLMATVGMAPSPAAKPAK